MLNKTCRKSTLFAAVSIAMLCLVAGPALAGSDKDANIQEPVKLAKISITGSLQDALPPSNPFGPTPMYFKRLLDLIDKAAQDKNIEGIVLEVDSPAIGFAKVHEVNKALKAFKDSGKSIFGYAESLGMKDLMIMSTCDYLAIPESGTVLIPGLSIEALYMKKFLKKLGVQFLVEHIGDYKTAFEDFSRDSMSDANREVLNCLLDEYYFSIINTIAKNRGIDNLEVIRAIDQAILMPDDAVKAGLIDATCYRDQFDDLIKSKLKAQKIEINNKYGRSDKDLDLDNPIVLFSQIMSSLTGKKKKESKNPKIALIYASGMIHSGKNQMDPFSGQVTIGSDTLAKAILDAADDETVKAIVLRVDSPGGSGLASDIIWHAEVKAAAKKPFIVSMGDVAGSGGYYIAMAADKIFAEPSTITGSIGVVSAIPNVSKTMDKLDITVERICRGRNASLMSLFAPPDEVNIKLLADYMEKFYWKFVDKVAAGRKMCPKEVHKLAQGRVWTGRQALDNGLVDVLGGLDDAILFARAKAGLMDNPDWEIKEMPESPDFFQALSEAMGVKVFLKEIMTAAGMNVTESFVLDNPEVRARIGRLYSVWNLCMNDSMLLLMPMDIQVNF